MGQTFFGLTDKYIEATYEQFFQLKHFGGWSFTEMYNLPVGLRLWWLKRLHKHYEEEKKEMVEEGSKQFGPYVVETPGEVSY